MAICNTEAHTHTQTPQASWQPDHSCLHGDPGNRHRKANSSVSFWPLMAIMAYVLQRGRWDLSVYENQIIKLHSQTWLISEAVAFLQTERNKRGQQRDEVCNPLKLCPPLTQYLSYCHSPGSKTISGCLYSTWEISQGYKLAQLPSFTLPQCHTYKGVTLGFFLRFQLFSLSCLFLPTFPTNLSSATTLRGCIEGKLQIAFYKI